LLNFVTWGFIFKTQSNRRNIFCGYEFRCVSLWGCALPTFEHLTPGFGQEVFVYPCSQNIKKKNFFKNFKKFYKFFFFLFFETFGSVRLRFRFFLLPSFLGVGEVRGICAGGNHSSSCGISCFDFS